MRSRKNIYFWDLWVEYQRINCFKYNK